MLGNWIGRKWFNAVHRQNLVYNTCWEDPRLDRRALDISSDDSIVVITSAGCNVLDYALAEPKIIHAVDVNPIQNALLELKLNAIRYLEYEEFFELFGKGRLRSWTDRYEELFRPHLSHSARRYWDRRGRFFNGSSRRGSFYFHGSSGYFAWLINCYIDRVAKMRGAVHDLLTAVDVQQQYEIFHGHAMGDTLWTPFIRWMLQRDVTLSMLGVPREQRRQIDTHYKGGICQFIRDRIEAVFTSLTLKDNYFWRVYLTGEYTSDCAPEYLKPENFARLKAGLIDRISVHTTTVQQFLETHDEPISRFVLLDHMDWLQGRLQPLLVQEWQAIVNRAAPETRMIWRSAGLMVDYIDPIAVNIGGRPQQLGDLLDYDHELAKELHLQDRVNTYGSFYIARLAGAAA